MKPATATPDTGSLDQGEIDKFSRLAARWWDEAGPFAPLHRLNPVRLGYIRQQIVKHYRLDEHSLKPFGGLAIADIGCGGGLVAEPLARLGARVTGLDADKEAITVARAHAAAGGLTIDYHAATSDALATAGARFDVVTALEIVEHVADVDSFIVSLRALVKPGGLLIMSTLNRTPQSYLAAIIGAEHLLRWVPRGTHDWRRFLKPSELARALRAQGFTIDDVTGVYYRPITAEFSLSARIDVNYFICSVIK